jgi:hypothetical protein
VTNPLFVRIVELIFPVRPAHVLMCLNQVVCVFEIRRMAHLSVSKEFGLHNKQKSQDLCQLQLRSLEDLLNSSSSSENEEEDEEESKEEESEDDGNEEKQKNGERNGIEIERLEEYSSCLSEFIYGPILTSVCPEELSNIFESKGQLCCVLPHSLLCFI